MPADRLRRGIAALVAIAALAVVGWGLFLDRDVSSENRVDSLAGRLRCPVCASESIADSTSQIARELRDVISEQVEAGRSDTDIEDFFVARYGEWVLLDPAPQGRNLVLFALPALAALGGLAAIAGLRASSRHRAPAGAPPEEAASDTDVVSADDPRRLKLEERIGQARADLAEIDMQQAAGEVDAATRDRLAARYRAEEAAARQRLAALRPVPPGRSRRRVVAGSAAFLVGAAIVVAGVVMAIEPRPEGGFATGGVATGAPGGQPRDLATVTNEEMEAVVAANPDVSAMRMALARRYLDSGEFDRALDHLLVVLEQQPTAEALAYVGWITYLGGETDLGVRYLERSLTFDPDRPEALWFLALARLETGDDPTGAVILLERLLANPDLQGDERDMVAQTLEQARQAAS